MLPYQQRVIDERDQLNDRRRKLKYFLLGEKAKELSVDDRMLMEKQLDVMIQYFAILNLRIERFSNE